jgi:hypothetical protein
MKRWHIRKGLMFLLVASAALYILAFDRMSGLCKCLVPVIVCSVLYVFGWYDLKTPLEPDDPARKELEEDGRDSREEKKALGERNEH